MSLNNEPSSDHVYCGLFTSGENASGYLEVALLEVLEVAVGHAQLRRAQAINGYPIAMNGV